MQKPWPSHLNQDAVACRRFAWLLYHMSSTLVGLKISHVLLKSEGWVVVEEEHDGARGAVRIRMRIRIALGGGMR